MSKLITSCNTQIIIYFQKIYQLRLREHNQKIDFSGK